VVADRRSALQRKWVHAHEEDTDEEMVFRPASHPLPPSRGRASFDLRPDGSYVERSPGPVDVPEESRGRWSLDGDRLVLDDGGRTWEIASVDDDRLRLKRG
jgi:hypothetical protein